MSPFFFICHFSQIILNFCMSIYDRIFCAKEDKMHIKSRVYNGTLYVVLCGELDENSASSARVTLDDIFGTSNFKQIIIDLSELEFMDSTGIGVLIGRYKKMQLKKIPIYICNPSRQAEKIFKMTGLYDIMPKIV